MRSSLTNNHSLLTKTKHSRSIIKVGGLPLWHFARLNLLCFPSAREAVSKKSSVARPALVWDSHLATLAEQWAKDLAAKDKGLKHTTSEERPGQGENLYVSRICPLDT